MPLQLRDQPSASSVARKTALKDIGLYSTADVASFAEGRRHLRDVEAEGYLDPSRTKTRSPRLLKRRPL